MTTIRESGFVLKVATGAAIGITDESLLDPANMSSGSATLGQVPSADGAGGITWSDEIGPVPSGRQILNGTGITGGGDLSADRTLSVVQNALDPANMSSGSATAGQYPRASGGGAVAWQDLPASIPPAASSTNHALVRWDGTGGDTVLDSGVTLSDAGAMVFPTAGSISKPGSGLGSQAFGSGAIADQASSLAVGWGASVHPVSSGDSTGAIAVGSGATVGNATPGAGCDAAIAIGENAVVSPGATDGIAIGKSASVPTNAASAMAIGPGASASAAGAVSIGPGCSAGSINNVSIGNDCDIASSNNAIAIGNNVDLTNAADAIAIGRGMTIATSSGFISLGVGPSLTGSSDAIALGFVQVAGSRAMAAGYEAYAKAANCVSLGTFARVHAVSSGDSTGSIAIGASAAIGNSTPGAGCDAAIALGESASVGVGSLYAIAVGASASVAASSARSAAFGNAAVCGSSSQVALGWQANSGTGASSIAIGQSTNCNTGAASIAIGSAAVCDGVASIAISSGAQAKADDAISIGRLSAVYPVSSGDSNGAIALGRSAIIGNATPGAGCDAAIAIGNSATVGVGAIDSLAVGSSATASGARNVALGPSANASQTDTIVIGYNSRVFTPSSGDNAGAIAIGSGADVNGSAIPGSDAAIAIGRNSNIGGTGGTCTDAIALGQNARVQTGTSDTAIQGIAIGANALTQNADGGISIGGGASVSADAAIAIGRAASSSVANRCVIGTIGGSYDVEVQFGNGLGAWGVTPPGSQPAKINDVTATAGASYTATEQGMLNDLKARVNSILDVLEGAGLSSAT